jgi:hypothetical protein
MKMKSDDDQVISIARVIVEDEEIDQLEESFSEQPRPKVEPRPFVNTILEEDEDNDSDLDEPEESEDDVEDLEEE